MGSDADPQAPAAIRKTFPGWAILTPIMYEGIGIMIGVDRTGRSWFGAMDPREPGRVEWIRMRDPEMEP